MLMTITFDLQEQELYQKEGLGVNEVHYVDNQDCIGMGTVTAFGRYGRDHECISWEHLCVPWFRH